MRGSTKKPRVKKGAREIYVLAIETEYAPKGFFPAGTLDDLRPVYMEKAGVFQSAPLALARIESGMKLYVLTREPDYAHIDASLAQRFTSATRTVKKTVAAVLRDAPETKLNAKNIGDDIVSFGRHLLKAGEKKLSNSVGTGRALMRGFINELNPGQANGVVDNNGYRYVKASWLLMHGEAGNVSLLRDPAAVPPPKPHLF